MFHLGLVGSGNSNPSNFRSTRMAAATLRSLLTPLFVGLNDSHSQRTTMVHMA